MIEEENEEFVRKAMDNLKEDEKEIIRLKLWEELQFNEICEVLSIGISSAKMKYYRALEKLKVELEVTI